MATTAFWPVYNHLKETIDYAENPDKTIERKYVDEDLYKTLQYAENSEKTDETMYVSAINCPKRSHRRKHTRSGSRPQNVCGAGSTRS